MTKLNRDALGAAVAARLGAPLVQGETALAAVLVCLAEGFAAGQNVELRGFGNFKVREVKEHPGRHPRTGEVITVPARRKVAFRFTGTL